MRIRQAQKVAGGSGSNKTYVVTSKRGTGRGGASGRDTLKNQCVISEHKSSHCTSSAEKTVLKNLKYTSAGEGRKPRARLVMRWS